MSFGGALVGLAAGAALATRFARAHGSGTRRRRWADAASDPSRADDDVEACPLCGADAMTFGYEEEVDSAGREVDVVRCFRCGWKRSLSPL